MATIRPLRQTYLEFTAQNTLTIVERLNIPRGEPFILWVPDELLLTIFELATSNPRYQESYSDCDCESPRPNYGAIKILVLTCHRFKRIALPLLYRTIRLDYICPTVPPSKAAKSLHRSLQKNPSLWQYCRVLWIQINDFPPEIDVDEFSIAHDLVSWLTKARCLRIYGGFGKWHREYTWPLIRNVVQHMGEIEHLTIAKDVTGPALSPIMEIIDIPSLRELNIYGVSHAMDGVAELDPKKHRTASFSTLSISYYEESPQGLALLLQWPKQLSHFYFGSIHGSSLNLDLPMLRSWLLMHKDTLRTIKIGCLTGGDQGFPFIASDFPKLEVLRLSRWSINTHLEFSSTEADSLLAPTLKTFEWDFNMTFPNIEYWNSFGEREEYWVRELARAAIERSTALKKIRIIFNPDRSFDKGDDYPWDRMDKIRDEIRLYGMLLEYTKPPISRESWLKEIADEPVFRSRSIWEFFPLLRAHYSSTDSE